MGLKDILKNRLDGQKADKSSAWTIALSHSQQIMQSLEISTKDLRELQEMQTRPGPMHPTAEQIGAAGFLKIEVEDKTFGLVTANVCAHAYGADSWAMCILIICINDADINNTIGGGTTFINHITEEWFEKLIKHINEEEDSVFDDNLIE